MEEVNDMWPLTGGWAGDYGEEAKYIFIWDKSGPPLSEGETYRIATITSYTKPNLSLFPNAKVIELTDELIVALKLVSYGKNIHGDSYEERAKIAEFIEEWIKR